MSKTVRELLRDAYIDGFRKGVETYAWWKDGRQLVGTGTFDLSAAMKSSAGDAEPYFEMWMEKQMAWEIKPPEEGGET